MNKIFCYVISFVVLFSAMTVCYAGDIPEGLLSDGNAQVYFGEIKSVDGESITVIQCQNIKGDFTKDCEVTYKEFGFTNDPEVGKQYLCGFLDDNNPVYIWEVTGFDTNTLEIKSEDNMSQRMQEYLNNGDFAKKEQERVTDIDKSKATLSPIEEDITVRSTNMENKAQTDSPSILPQDDFYCITAIMNERNDILVWYIDMIAEQGIDIDGVPYFKDLYLDLVVYPDGNIMIDDMDELEEALFQKDITEQDYE